MHMIALLLLLLSSPAWGNPPGTECVSESSLPLSSLDSLTDVLLPADALVEPLHPQTLPVLGQPVTFQAYRVTTKVSLQVACGIVTADFADGTNVYTLRVAPDHQGAYRDALLRHVYDYWATRNDKSIASEDYPPTHVFSHYGTLIPYLWPDNERPGATATLGLPGTLVSVTLESTEGWGGLSGFLGSRVAFTVEGFPFFAYRPEPKYPVADFRRRYRAGDFGP